VLWWISSKILLIRHLECTTQFSQCPSSLENRFSKLINRPILSRLPAPPSLPTVESVSMIRQFPDTLLVSVKLRTPIGIISPLASPGKFYLIGSDGTQLGIAPDSDLPVLYYDGNELPAKLNSRQLTSMQILNQMVRLFSSRISGHLTQNQLLVAIPDGPQIFLDADQPSFDWYSSLQLILERSKISLKSPKIIDLRFTNPVLTY